MYGPAPSRPSKTGTRRSKAGCVSCRQKKRKCDESKPSCARCRSSGNQCSYNIAVEFRDATRWAAQKVKRRVDRGSKERGLSTPSKCHSQELDSHSPCPSPSPSPYTGFQLSPPSECDAPTIEVMLPPDEAIGRNELEQAQGRNGSYTSAALIHAHQSLSERHQSAAAISGDEPLIGITSPFTDLEYLEVRTPDAINPSWSGDTASVALPEDVGQAEFEPSSFNIAWQYLMNAPPPPESGLAFSDFSTSNFDPATVAQQDSQSILTPPSLKVDFVPPQSASSTTGNACDIIDSPANRALASRYEQTIWLAPLPSRVPDMPARDRLYLAHFMSSIIGVMPGPVRYLREMAMESEPIRSCANALAAASLANRGGRYSNDGRGRWVAVQSHCSRASSFASRSRDIIQSGSGILLGCRIVMLTLMLCFQLESGCIGDIYRALAALDSAILNNRDEVLSLPYSDGLVNCWLGLRNLCEGTLRPHALYGTESITELMVSKLEVLAPKTSESFSILATKAQRIGRRIMLYRRIDPSGDGVGITDALEEFEEWWSVIKCEQSDGSYETHDSGSYLHEDELFYELGQLRDALDVSKVPAGLPLNFDPAVTVSPTATLEPFQMADHEQAMELAAYAAAQIACDEDNLRALVSPRYKPSASRHPWLHLLMRVAAGLDLARCSRRNMYRHGICYYLQCAVFQLQDLSAACFLDGLFQRMIDAGSLYEGCLTPLNLSSLCNKMFCRQLAQGRTIFLICPTHNVWTTRDVLYAKRDEEPFLICGRESDGRFFDDVATLQDYATAV